MKPSENMSFLVDEYSTLFASSIDDSIDAFKNMLVREADWSEQAALHLLRLAKNNGSFILRNALAISLALGIEDGDLGF